MANPLPLCEQDVIACLLHKVSKVRVPLPNEINLDIPTIDVYGDQEPWEMFNQYPDEREIYFFARLKRNDVLFIRKCGNGSWLTAGNERTVLDNEENVIGLTRIFKYKMQSHPVGCDSHGKQYYRREYRLSDKFDICIRDDYKDYVFCTVIKRDAANRTRFPIPLRKSATDVHPFLNQMLEANSAEAAPSSSAPSSLVNNAQKVDDDLIPNEDLENLLACDVESLIDFDDI